MKGNQYELYEPEIRTGILLHRMIDDFTDTHPLTKITRDRLRPGFGKYSGVVADMFYDHFLAAGFEGYYKKGLHEYSIQVYQTLYNYWDILPEKIRFMLRYMKRDNWLLAYSEIKGIHRALTGLSKRVNHPSSMDKGAKFLEENYDILKKDFELFFPELQEKCHLWLNARHLG